jgi:hypothetical protein
MTSRTVELVTYDHYLNDEYAGACAADYQEHQLRLLQFPYNVVLRLSYPEMDFANRWSWQKFGPPDGECLDSYSEYPTCSEKMSHRHDGKWMSHWLAKTDYNFGYNEWCFELEVDQQRFLEFVPFINWGEKFPK